MALICSTVYQEPRLSRVTWSSHVSRLRCVISRCFLQAAKTKKIHSHYCFRKSKVDELLYESL